ncbi:hypothetical protein ACFL4F_04305, partial [Candidatus Margulisiibacteriota bacterium]
MAFNYFDQGGFSTIAIPKPQTPIKHVAPDVKTFFEHYGETDYDSFCETVGKLFSSFKFLPEWDQKGYEFGTSMLSMDDATLLENGIEDAVVQDFLAAITGDESFSKQDNPGNGAHYFGYGSGKAFSNLVYSPGASTWEYVEGYDSLETMANLAIKAELEAAGGTWSNDWSVGSIRNSGNDHSYYEIATASAADGYGIDNYSNEEAFYLMASMLESRTRVFNTWNDILGTLTNDPIGHIESWMNADVDPHNIGILKMFFGMQSDFINTVDAFINHATYWGDSFDVVTSSDTDPLPPAEVTDLGLFAVALGLKVDAYIDTLVFGSAKHDAATELKDKWFKTGVHGSYQSDRMDGMEIDGTWMQANDIIDSDDDVIDPATNWIKFFWGKLKEAGDKEVIRVIVSHVYNRSSQATYKREKKEYEEKVEEAKRDEAIQKKAVAKRIAKAKAEQM